MWVPLCPDTASVLGQLQLPGSDINYFSEPTSGSTGMWGLPHLHFEEGGTLTSWILFPSCHFHSGLFPHIPITHKVHQQVCCLRRSCRQETTLFTFPVICLSSPPSHTWLERRNDLVHPLPKRLSSSPQKFPGSHGWLGPFSNSGPLIDLSPPGGWLTSIASNFINLGNEPHCTLGFSLSLNSSSMAKRKFLVGILYLSMASIIHVWLRYHHNFSSKWLEGLGNNGSQI